MPKKKGAPASPFVPVEDQPYPIPENWCWIRFQDVVEIMNGFAFKSERYVDNGIRIIRIANVQDGYLEDYKPAFYPFEARQEIQKYLLESDDLLISLTGNVGRVAFLNSDMLPAALNQRVGCLRLKKSLLKKLLFFYMLRKEFQDSCIKNSKGTAQLNMSTEWLKRQLIPLPPLGEQQRIVDRIESLFAKLDEAKEKAQAVVDGFELRKSAILHKAFTGELTERWRKEHGVGLDSWQKTNIGSIADVKGGKRVPKGMSLTTDDTGHPYIKAGNLKLGTVLDEGIMFVPDDVLQYIKNYTVTAGDVYITNVGACIGDCGVIPDKYDGANLTENAVKITNLKCDGHFLSWYISSNEVQQRIKNLIASATLGKLSIANIKTMPVSLPTKEEQQEIVCILKDLQSREQQAKSAAESVFDQIDTIKKVILARAFRGELGTNDPAEEWAGELVTRIGDN